MELDIMEKSIISMSLIERMDVLIATVESAPYLNDEYFNIQLKRTHDLYVKMNGFSYSGFDSYNERKNTVMVVCG